MSQTYNIICKDCKKTIWVGQGRYSDLKKGYLYSKNKTFEFLIDHLNHNLVFVNAESDLLDDAEEIEND